MVRERTLQQMILKHLGLTDYATAYQAMQDFNAQRDADTPDEIWLLEHPPVFTLGLAAKPEHILYAGNIPVVKIDRGGQVTYHGPCQLVVYLLLDLKRRNIGVRELVRANLYLQIAPRHRNVIGAIPVDRIGGMVTRLVASRVGS